MKALSSIVLLCLAAGCSSSKAGPGAQDPYQDVGSFCEQWGKAACNAQVVANCLASSTDACVASQKEFCLGLVPPSSYSSQNASACIKAVHDAYADAVLTADEYKIVTKLAAPCDQLEKGPGASGASCSSDSDCNTLDGLHCIVRPGDASGACYKPEVQQGGYPCDQPQQTCVPDFACQNGVCTHVAKGKTTDPCTRDSDCESDICAVAAGSGRCADKIILDPNADLCTHLR